MGLIKAEGGLMKKEKEKRRESTKRICAKWYPGREWGKVKPGKRRQIAMDI